MSRRKYYNDTEYGKKKEIEFSKLFKNVIIANDYQNMNEHWDVKIEGIKIDVKGIKNWKGNLDDTIHHIEFINVNGDTGWLYGDADGFAFETNKNWVIVNKEILQYYIYELFKNKKFIVFDTPTLYELSQRKKFGRNDLITTIKTQDLLNLNKTFVIDKK